MLAWMFKQYPWSCLKRLSLKNMPWCKWQREEMKWANCTLFFPLPPSFALNSLLESLAIFYIKVHQLCILACFCLLGFFHLLTTSNEVIYFARGWRRLGCVGHLGMVGVSSESVICLCFKRRKQAHGFIGFQSFVFILT